MREAPGTYQHSLQVANLSEQVANAIGANSELTRVAALYHDIGKMLNPAFFTENQSSAGNPHDILNDPYRSADIIISHVTEGDDMARQYRLPVRLRDFIREHHGTSQVYVFYRQAVILAGDDPSAVDVTEFTYPGPKPQSRETAVLMLADSCESAARSRQPKNKQEIEEIVVGIIDQKRTSGQLDESALTLNDLKSIQTIFIDMLQAIYHTRLNYDEAVSRVRKPDKPADRTDSTRPVTEGKKPDTQPRRTGESPSIKRTGTNEIPVINSDEDDGNTPLAEVPRLRRRGKGGDRPDDSESSIVDGNENSNGHMEVPAIKADDNEDEAPASDSAESESETTRGQQSDT
jgi:hypothetical protein